MHKFAKSRRYRSTAVFVLLGWIFSLVLSSAYACTLADSEHHHESRHGDAVMKAHTDAKPHSMPIHGSGDDVGNGDTKLCKASCDLHASPIVKEVSGHAPDIHFIALYTSSYILAFAPWPGQEPRLALHTETLTAGFPSLRSTRLTL